MLYKDLYLYFYIAIFCKETILLPVIAELNHGKLL